METTTNPFPEVDEKYIVTASKTIDGETATGSVVWKPGDTLGEAVAKYGEEAVYELYVRAGTVKLQAQIRGELEKGATQDDLNRQFPEDGSWDPSETRAPSRDPLSVIKSTLNKMSAEDRAAFLAELRGQ